MKTATILTIAGLSASLASAAIITPQSGTGNAFGLQVLDTNGAAIPNGTGYIAVGEFSVADSAISAGNLVSTFSSFGPALTFGSGGFDGIFQGDINIGSTAGGINNAGDTIYLVFGNASTLGDSTQVAVYRSTAVVPTDTGGPTPETVTVSVTTASGNVLVAGSQTTATVGNSTLEAIQLVDAVPEPSSSLLALAGLAGLAARRRR